VSESKGSLPSFPDLAVSSFGVARGESDGFVVEPLDSFLGHFGIREGDDGETIFERRDGDDVDGSAGEGNREKRSQTREFKVA